VVLEGLLEEWRAYQLWSPEYLREHFGDNLIQSHRFYRNITTELAAGGAAADARLAGALAEAERRERARLATALEEAEGARAQVARQAARAEEEAEALAVQLQDLLASREVAHEVWSPPPPIPPVLTGHVSSLLPY